MNYDKEFADLRVYMNNWIDERVDSILETSFVIRMWFEHGILVHRRK